MLFFLLLPYGEVYASVVRLDRIYTFLQSDADN